MGELHGSHLAKLTVLTKEKIETEKWVVRDGKLVKKPIYLKLASQIEAPIQVGVAGDQAGAPTGFGSQIGVLSGALKCRGYSVSTHSRRGSSLIDWSGDVFITLGELQQFIEMLGGNVRGWVHWLPITSRDFPKLFWDRLSKVPHVVAMSQFGLQVIEANGFPKERLHYIPHSVDTSIFRPLSPYVRRKARDEAGMEGFFSLIFVGTNRPRKDLRALLTAFKMALDIVKSSDMKLTLKTSAKGDIDVQEVVEDLGIKKHVDVQDVLMDAGALAKVYAAHDLYVTAAKAEGFGVPIVEAMACGLPVVAGDHSTSSELIGDSGSVVSCSQELVKLYDYENVTWHPVDQRAMADAIVYHYEFWKKGFKVDRSRIRGHTLKNFSREVVVGQWEDLINRIVEENS